MPDAAQFTSYAKLLRLTPVEEATPASMTPASLTPASPSSTTLAPATSPAAGSAPVLTVAAAPRMQAGRQRRGLVSFALLVALPTLLAVTYFGLLAADRYQSEAQFVLRMPGRMLGNAALGLALQNSGAGSAGVARSMDDSYLVQEFLESRDAMTWAEKHAALRTAYDAAPARRDILWRFPNPLEPAGEEGLFRHFQRMVSSSFDSTTGLNTIKVQAFAPGDAQRIADALLTAAETLVNRLNERARQGTIARAEAEVTRLRTRIEAAQAALTAFRERERLIDPGQATLAVLETIARLSQEAALASVQIGELGKGSPNSPQLGPLRTRRAAIEAQIALERQRLAGDAQSIAPRIVEYERLMLEREFAEKALVSAMTALETARAEAMAQQIYLERVTQPSAPDHPAHPWRVLWSLAVAVAGYMAWRMWRIVSEDTIAHAES
jgi:capsular polysaccharide transport system permease protein